MSDGLCIDGRTIGPGRRTFVIAELGVNHDGSVNKAIDLVRIAASCGADAVKLQLFRATSLLHPTCQMAAYQKKSLRDDTPIDMRNLAVRCPKTSGAVPLYIPTVLPSQVV